MEIITSLYKIKPIEKKINRSADNFFVEEIDIFGNIYEINKIHKPKWEKEEDYMIVVMQKRNWSTINATKEICKKLGISKKRVSFAGNKDKNSTSVQLISLYKTKIEEIEKINIKDIKILGKWYWDKKIQLGDLLGNRFRLKVSLSESDILLFGEILESINSLIPNYFGEQRFGIRKNNHLIGKLIVKNDLKNAVLEYLTASRPDENSEVRKIRKELKDTLDFKRAIKEYPTFLKNERILLEHLVKNPNDFVGAFRKLHKKILLMFVHAYQSYLFNKNLAKKIEEERLFEIESGEYFCGLNWYSFPDIYRINGKIPVGKIIGYDTKINESEKKLLEEEGIGVNDFKIKSIPELSQRGSYRPILVPLKDFIVDEDGISFELPAGSYATVALRELISVVN
ncbi:MAG: tRNA pseudouridine(13) synthase TruD [Candidatus Micrarchaeia archaeon]